MKIQQATRDDAAELLALQQAAYLSEAALHDDYSIPPLTQTLAELLEDVEHKHILKITDEANCLLASGQVSLSGNSCYIGRMAVWPQHQGGGIGSRLLTALESVFPEAQRAELFTGEHSERNLSMYQRRGYTPFKTALLGDTRVVFLERYLQEQSGTSVNAVMEKQ